MRARRPAVFLDKDGTLVRDVPYNVDPELVRLVPGAGPALASLVEAGYVLVCVTNQSGVARGLFDECELDAVWQRIDGLLAPSRARITAYLHCPHHPDGRMARYTKTCECRKPRPGLLLRAARELSLDLGRSWMVGDILDDVEAGARAGCRTILVDGGGETEWSDGPYRRPDVVCGDLPQASAQILARAAAAPAVPVAATYPSRSIQVM